MAILVCGGAGYIGSHTCIELIKAGYEIIVVDNLSNSSESSLQRVKLITGCDLAFVKGDLCDKNVLKSIFEEYDIDAVIHFAGYKAVGESVNKPLEYYENNLISTINLLKIMQEYNVNNLIFSSSATVYGNPHSVPITESFPTGGTTNPYGTTKLFAERIISDYCASNKAMNAVILRYFNPIGAHESGLIGEDPNGIPNNLVPYISQVAVGKLEKLHVYGNDYPTPDGTGVRDFIHVVDLAKGHVAALKKLVNDCGLFICNLGTGMGYSVLDVVNTYERVSGRHIPYVIEPRRSGDISICYADTQKAYNEMGWKAELSLDDMCYSSWKWQKMNPNGYKE